MGQCCNQSHTNASTPNISKQLSAGSTADNISPAYKHHPLSENPSSDSQSVTQIQPNQLETTPIDDSDINDYDENTDEMLDLSAFQEEVAEFIDFWYQHYEKIKSHSIHNALVTRIHSKLKEEYELFPRNAIDEFIRSLPEILEALETLVNVAIDGEISDAINIYKEFQILSLSINNNNTKHRKHGSFSIKLTPAFNENETENVNACTLPIPPSPSHTHSKSRTRSRSRSRSRSRTKNKLNISPRDNELILTDKDGVDVQINEKKVTFQTEKTTQIVVTKPMEQQQQQQQQQPSPEPIDMSNSDEAAYALFEGSDVNNAQPQISIMETPNSFIIESADDAEIILVGIMRTLWFDRIQKLIINHDEIDDIFFILSNALETAIGTFREYKDMMETFSLRIRRSLRITLELVRAIIYDLSLNVVLERNESMYDDPFSILIHFADRCEVACDFWNEYVCNMASNIKLQLSMRVYSYAILNVEQETYDRLKQNGAINRWSNMLLDFMENIIRFFSRNRHQDLMQYLIILASHHEKMKIPSTLLGNMGNWIDAVFVEHFDEDIYLSEVSDGIQFIYAFVGEVMSGAYSKPIYDVNVNADEIDETVLEITRTHTQTPTTKRHNTLSGHIELPTSLHSVVQMSAIYNDHENEEDVFGHIGMNPSMSFNFSKGGQGSTTLSAQMSVIHDVTHLDLDKHPSLTDIVMKDSSKNVQTPSLKHNASAPPPITTTVTTPTTSANVKENSLKPPHQISMFLQNSPLSRLDSPTISPVPAYSAPDLTPIDHKQISPELTEEKENNSNDIHLRFMHNNGARAVTLSYFAHSRQDKEKQNKLNVNAIDDNDEKESKKKRSFSQADNHLLKHLAPDSLNNYTNTSSNHRKRPSSSSNSMNSSRNRHSSSRTSSSMLFDKKWKPMHFLQVIMDMEGRKIISNYAFAPSDGSFSEKIVDLSIFHGYFEVAQTFWSRFVDVNDRERSILNDKLLNVFSERITDMIRSEIHELFAQKQINFVFMFCFYFQLLRQYLDKCKSAKNAHSALLPPAITPSLRNKPNSTNKVLHKRTFSQRSSMSLRMSKMNSLRSDIIKSNHNYHQFHNEGQFFVREMLRIGTKHRANGIQEKTLKLVAKCLIEVIEKQYAQKFDEKTKRAFTISLKLGIKFMCVDPKSNKRTKKKVKSPTKSLKSTSNKLERPKISLNQKSAPIYGVEDL